MTKDKIFYNFMTKIDVPAIDDADISDVPQYTPEQLADANFDWKGEALKQTGIATRRTTQLKKTKEFLTTHKDKFADGPEPVTAPKKGELNDGQKAILIASGFKDAEDQAYIQKTMVDTGRTLDEVIGTQFVQAELKRMGEERASKAATPPADGRNRAPTANDVAYWLEKGHELPEDKPENRKLRSDIVKARREKSSKSNMFTDQAVGGNQ